MLVQHHAEATDQYRVLIFVHSTDDTATIARVLHEHDIPTLTCRTDVELSTEIEIGGGAVIVSSECLQADNDKTIFHALQEQQFADVPLIVLTGEATQSDRRQDVLAKVNRVCKMLIWKPPHPLDELVHVAKELVAAKKQSLRSVDDSQAR